MSKVLRINWTNEEAGDYVCLLPMELFADEIQRREIVYRMVTDEGDISAKCTLQVAGDVATLKYRKDVKEDWWVGITRIVFDDRNRQSIKEILWADEGALQFENLHPVFQLVENQESRDEVTRQMRLGKIASRPEQTDFSNKLRALYSTLIS